MIKHLVEVDIEVSQSVMLSAYPCSSILQGLKLLVVEANPEASEILRLLFEGEGAEVKAVESASAALAEIPQFCPDILLSELEIPGQDGYSLIEAIRTTGASPWSQIPAIAVTVAAEASDRIRALKAGFHKHLAKPIDLDELMNVVARLVGRL